MYSHNLLLERSQRAIVDGLGVFAGAVAAVWIRHGSGWIGDTAQIPWSTYLFPATVVASLTVLALHLSGSYREPHRVVPIWVLLGALSLATITVLIASVFYRSVSYSRATVILFVPLAALTVIGIRFLYDHYVRAVWRRGSAVQRVVIVGRTAAGIRLADALARQPVYYELVGFVDDSNHANSNGSEPAVLGPVSALGDLLAELAIDEVLICLPDDPARVMDVIGVCMRQRVTWKAMPSMFGLRLERIHVDDFDGIPLLGLHSSRLIGFSWVVKRGFDLAVATISLIVLSPILLATAVAVRITSRGPILYKQTRVGLNGQPFTMLKFRSMKTGSSQELHSEYTKQWIYGKTGAAFNGNGGATGVASDGSSEIHKIKADPRITRVGRFIRATSLDELPQLWNVLRGDMSVVGPRPAMPYEVDRYTEWHKRRLAVPPGITGAWQVAGRNELSFDQMIALDVDYIETWSVEKDVTIMLQTVPAVLKLGGK